MSKTCSKDQRARITHNAQSMRNEDDRIDSYKETYLHLNIPVKELIAVVMRMPKSDVFEFIKAVDQTMEDGEFTNSLYQYFHDLTHGIIALEIEPTLDNCHAKFKEMEEKFKNEPEVAQQIDEIESRICHLATDIRSSSIVYKLSEELNNAVTVKN